jgi:hypothetical protein
VVGIGETTGSGDLLADTIQEAAIPLLLKAAELLIT